MGAGGSAPDLGMSLPSRFAAAMQRLGPFEPAPRLAVAVSGGADSMALALLAQDWVLARAGNLLALVVDHGLRAASSQEAALTVARLTSRSIPAILLRLTDLTAGPALAARARVARYAILRAACLADGRLHLLLGHHAADQAETVLLRREGGSGQRGLAGMSALLEQDGLRLLRPLLAMPPGPLRELLHAERMGWVEDPSNADLRTTRGRLRGGLADPAGTGPDIVRLCEAARTAGRDRAAQDLHVAEILAERAAIHPEGFARLSDGAIEPAALSALVQTISGAAYPPPAASIAALAERLRPATLAGVRVLPAGRSGRGWLLVREAAAVGPPVPATPGVVWDHRFRLALDASPSHHASIAALGRDSAGLRRQSSLPAAVLQVLPAIRSGNLLVAVPHLDYPDPEGCARVTMGFSPGRPAAGAPYLPI